MTDSFFKRLAMTREQLLKGKTAQIARSETMYRPDTNWRDRTLIGSVMRHYFGFDATASRSETWDAAMQMQAKLAQFLADSGEVLPQLSINYFNGIATFRGTKWTNDVDKIVSWMSGVRCEAGHTQIARLFRDVQKKITSGQNIATVQCVFDHMDGDHKEELIVLAKTIGITTPINIWHEVVDVQKLEKEERLAAETFREIAKVSGGLYHPFQCGKYDDLRSYVIVSVALASGEDSGMVQRLTRNPQLLTSEGQRLLRLSRS